jgi:hypothetical protein
VRRSSPELANWLKDDNPVGRTRRTKWPPHERKALNYCEMPQYSQIEILTKLNGSIKQLLVFAIFISYFGDALKAIKLRREE